MASLSSHRNGFVAFEMPVEGEVAVAFTDGGFSATTMGIRPVSAAGRAWFAKHFGELAASATLRKSGGYEAMSALAAEGLRYSVEEA